MKIVQINSSKKQFLDLLLIGDEDESMIERYLDRGDLFILRDNGVKAVCVVTGEGNGVCELKNIAVRPEAQRQGYGGKLMEHIIQHYTGKYREMIVGTGETPRILRFYARYKFVYSHRIARFFTDNYPHPIFEEGIQLKDMIYLKRTIA